MKDKTWTVPSKTFGTNACVEDFKEYHTPSSRKKKKLSAQRKERIERDGKRKATKKGNDTARRGEGRIHERNTVAYGASNPRSLRPLAGRPGRLGSLGRWQVGHAAGLSPPLLSGSGQQEICIISARKLAKRGVHSEAG